MTWDNNYHKKYLLREENGELFSDLVELHILELNKVLTGRRVDEWIRLFNVETEEDLEILETMTRNPGILEAVKEVRRSEEHTSELQTPDNIAYAVFCL